MTKRTLPAIAALLLSACAGGGQDGRGYPSLAKRPIETGAADDAEATPVDGNGGTLAGEQGPEPALLKQLSDLAMEVGKGDAQFNRAYDESAGRIRVATSAPVSSEQWVAAHVLLGKLEQARYQSAVAMASLDMLYAERMNAIAQGKAAGGIPQIEAQRMSALAIIDAQNDKVDALRAVLKEP